MTISAQVIDTIVELVDDNNLNQPLRIDDIARHAGYSKWHLQRLLCSTKGESLGRYIERKLKLAARDLRDTDQKVYDICLKYGFDSQQTFARAFLPARSTLPRGAYRKSMAYALKCLIGQRKPAPPDKANNIIFSAEQQKP